MTAMATEDNRELQRQLYGEPLSDIAGRIRSGLSLTQGGLAEVLGLSAPMLSQLLSGQRGKIGNPQVLGRLQALMELAEIAPAMTSAQLDERLAAIRDAAPTITTTQTATKSLRAAAPREELERLASLTTYPELARLLRNAAHE